MSTLCDKKAQAKERRLSTEKMTSGIRKITEAMKDVLNIWYLDF